MTAYDGNKINAEWGNAWPPVPDVATVDVTNPNHEFSPVLSAPVATLLGDEWTLEAGSPGGDFVIWYRPTGDTPWILGVSPMVTKTPRLDGESLVAWLICLNKWRDDMSSDDFIAMTEVPLYYTPAHVAEAVRKFAAQHIPDFQ